MEEFSLAEARILSKKGEFVDVSQKGILYDSVKQPNPDSEGNNSRNGFKFSCYYNSLGIFFQKQVKNAILRAVYAAHNNQIYEFHGDFLALQNALYKSIRARINNDSERKQPFMLAFADILVYYAYDNTKLQSLNKNKIIRESINFAHSWTQKYYDKEAYIYDDQRINSISKLLKEEIESFRKDESLLKIIDICCFLMKEDVHYRARWIQILQDIKPTVEKIDIPNNPIINILKDLCSACAEMNLTPYEISNVELYINKNLVPGYGEMLKSGEI